MRIYLASKGRRNCSRTMHQQKQKHQRAAHPTYSLPLATAALPMYSNLMVIAAVTTLINLFRVSFNFDLGNTRNSIFCHRDDAYLSKGNSSHTDAPQCRHKHDELDKVSSSAMSFWSSESAATAASYHHLLLEIASCASCASIQMKSTMHLLDSGTHYHREAHRILQ